jgi:hypothetical protein
MVKMAKNIKYILMIINLLYFCLVYDLYLI